MNNIKIYSLLLKHSKEFLILKNKEGLWELPGGTFNLKDESYQFKVATEIENLVPTVEPIRLYYSNFMTLYKEKNLEIFKQQLEISEYARYINLNEDSCKFIDLRSFLKEPNKVHSNKTLLDCILKFYKLKDTPAVIEDGWKETTQSYELKYKGKPLSEKYSPSFRQVWLLDVQCSDAPKELNREVEYIWESWSLGNDFYYKKFTLKDLKLEYEEDLPLITKYILEEIHNRDLSIKDEDQILIHWWW